MTIFKYLVLVHNGNNTARSDTLHVSLSLAAGKLCLLSGFNSHPISVSPSSLLDFLKLHVRLTFLSDCLGPWLDPLISQVADKYSLIQMLGHHMIFNSAHAEVESINSEQFQVTSSHIERFCTTKRGLIRKGGKKLTSTHESRK